MRSTKILGLAGSLRRASYNAALLRAAAELAPEGCEVDVATIRGIPVYDGDLESSEGLPPAVVSLKERVVAADALLLGTPEYNNSLPGPLKNALDWLTRPPKDIPRVFSGKPVGLIGATPGGGGTRLSQTAWLPVLRTLNTRPFFERSVFLARAGKLFDEQRRLTDEESRRKVADYMETFVAFVRA